MTDTLLSFPEESGRRPFHGLKVFFLDEVTAIAYSGTAGEVAHGRLCAIYNNGIKGDIAALAEQINTSFDNEVHFLLAQCGDNPIIAKVADGLVSIRQDDGVYWIGDIDGARYVARTDSNSSDLLRERFSNAIENPQFDTVGGHAVTAKGNTEGFKFVPYMMLVSPNYTPLGDNWNTIDWGTAQTGGFGYTTVTPANPGVNGWGIFYFQGMFGEFFHFSFETNICGVLRSHARSAEEFVEIIKNETDIELTICANLR